MEPQTLIIIILSGIVALMIVGIIILLRVFIPILKEETTEKVKYYADLSMNTTQGSIVFLGDSITEFYRTSEFFHDYNTYNRGIAGDTTDGVLDRIEDNVIPLKPQKIFLLIGTNDLPKHKKDKVIHVVTNIKRIIQKIEQETPETKLYVESILPVNRTKYLYSRYVLKNRDNEDIEKVNDELKKNCHEKGITYIDLYPRLLDENKELKEEYTLEGLHISFKGYQEITGILKPYLDE
jgi:lysophospholipase L1-like esterase